MAHEPDLVDLLSAGGEQAVFPDQIFNLTETGLLFECLRIYQGLLLFVQQK